MDKSDGYTYLAEVALHFTFLRKRAALSESERLFFVAQRNHPPIERYTENVLMGGPINTICVLHFPAMLLECSLAKIILTS